MAHRSARSPARLAVLSTVALAVAAAATVTMASPKAAASTPIYLGAAGDEVSLSRSIGAPLSDHAYAHFHNKVRRRG